VGRQRLLLRALQRTQKKGKGKEKKKGEKRSVTVWRLDAASVMTGTGRSSTPTDGRALRRKEEKGKEREEEDEEMSPDAMSTVDAYRLPQGPWLHLSRVAA